MEARWQQGVRLAFTQNELACGCRQMVHEHQHDLVAEAVTLHGRQGRVGGHVGRRSRGIPRPAPIVEWVNGHELWIGEG